MNNEINTGGPAFPHDDQAQHYERAGMTMRDYFAAKAMQGMLGATWPDRTDTQETAYRAYELANYMIQARNQRYS